MQDDDTPLYEQIRGELLFDPFPPPTGEPRAATAGEQDHTNPWFYAGAWAPPPAEPS